MRSAFAAAAGLAAAVAGAQAPLHQTRPFFTRLAQLGYLDSPIPREPLPTEATGQPLPTPQSEVPAVPTPPNPRDIQLIHADRTSRTADQVRLEGAVHFRYRGYEVFADRVEGDTRTQIFTLEGKVTLLGEDALVQGDFLTVDFRNRTYVARAHRAVAGPARTGGRTTDDVYFRGESGAGGEREMHMRNGSMTTCELDVPHYRIDARDVVLRPEKRIILRDARIRVMGRTLVRIPYVSIPLDSRRERYTPEVGQSRDEGYYIKTVWGVPMSGNQDFDAYLDYFEKLGAGIGGRYRFAGSDVQGFLRAYSIQGNNDTVEVSGGVRKLFGANLFSLETNLQQRNYLNAPENTFLTTRASLVVPQGRNYTRFSFYSSSNESPTFRTESQTVGIADDRRFGRDTRWNLSVNWATNRSEFSTGDPVSRERVDVSFRGTHDMRRAVAELEYQRSIPVGDTANFFSATDRTPVVSLRTDSRRLFGGLPWALRWPFSTEVSVGEFANSATSDHITRTHFDFHVNRPDQADRRDSLAVQFRFRQGLYSDDTAQYSTLLNTSYRHSFSSDTALHVRYHFMKPTGFTPLSIDRIGRANVATADVSAKIARSLTAGIQSGYDFRYRELGLETGWQQMAARLEWRPSRNLLGRSVSTYDPLLRKWSQTRLDLTYERGELYAGIGARYDGVRSLWGSVNLFVDGIRFGKFSASALLNYNGYTKQFDTRQYSLIYDMHCTEAVLQVLENNVGFRPGRQVYFFLRIKALPFGTPFGTGTHGQPIGTGTGFGY